ncbi:MAG: Mur ligase family protein [Candidatus Lernaella stagnicola]|nr:Mur ligase family protein [Candidatus Lernaella stagnicola]
MADCKLDTEAIRHIHLIAVCGAGMGSLAGMLKALGYHVTGSDVGAYPPMSEQLEALGIKILEGYDPSHLEPRPDLVVIGNAISKGNAEGDAAIAAGIDYISMTDALRLFFFRRKTLAALCGTHGKTTSTAALAWILEHGGFDPTYLVGGVMENTDASYRVGQSSLAVVEGDEYDTAWFDKVPKFVRYRPDLAVLENIEFDHADIYDDLDAVRDAFRQLVTALPAGGVLAAGIDCPNVRDLVKEASCEVVSFGFAPDARVGGEILAVSPAGMRFVLRVDGEERGPFESVLSGKHNLLNLMGVYILARRLGVSDAGFADGLATFRGIKRRQQVIGEAAGVLVIDDFAHHPTAVRVTLESLRAARPGRRLVTVFEPRTNTSRRAFFQEEYAKAFAAADLAVIVEVQALQKGLPEDVLDVARLVRELEELGTNAVYAADYDDALRIVLERAHAGDQIAFLSNGGFGKLPRRAAAALSEKEMNRAE